MAGLVGVAAVHGKRDEARGGEAFLCTAEMESRHTHSHTHAHAHAHAGRQAGARTGRAAKEKERKQKKRRRTGCNWEREERPCLISNAASETGDSSEYLVPRTLHHYLKVGTMHHLHVAIGRRRGSGQVLPSPIWCH
jgi:hypothetical protein